MTTTSEPIRKRIRPLAGTCIVCLLPERAEIDRALRSGETASSVRRRFGLRCGITTLRRHRREHVLGAVPTATATPPRPTCPGAAPIGGALYCDECAHLSWRVARCLDWGDCRDGLLVCSWREECPCCQEQERHPDWRQAFDLWRARRGQPCMAVCGQE